MSQKKASRNISSLTDRIVSLETELGVQASQFAYHVASGMKKWPAFIAAYGYSNGVMVNRNYGKALPLILLLKEENQQHITDQLHMDKESRLELLLETALIARQKYDESSEAAHGAVFLKAMATINTMTGDNAATEVHHMVSVTHEQLEAMTHSQRTDAYKRMMSNKLELIDNKEESIIEGELVSIDEGGATLDDGVG